MPTTERQLLIATAPVVADIADTDERLIKGFVSVEKEDRSGDLVPPEEFNLAQYLSIPTMMLNHKFYHDEFGNEVGIGTPKDLFVATLRKNADNPDVWNVVDKSGEVRNTYPKSKVPNLKAGDRGLFIVAEITRDRVWKMIQDGELSAFSWRGLVEVKFRVNQKTRKLERILSNIDLFEISVVNVPDNPNSSFLVGKTGLDSNDSDDYYVVYAVRLDKSHFPSASIAREYFKLHRLDGEVREDETSYFCKQHGADHIQVGRLQSIKMSEGVFLISGPLTDEATKQFTPPCLVAQVLGDEAAQYLTRILEKGTMSKNAETVDEKVDEKAAADEATTVETKEEEKTSEETKETKDESKDAEKETEKEKAEEKPQSEAEKGFAMLAETISKQTAEQVGNTLAPMLENVSTALKGLAEISAKASGVDTEETKEGEEKSTDETKEGDAETKDEKKDADADVVEGPHAETLKAVADICKAQNEEVLKQVKTQLSKNFEEINTAVAKQLQVVSKSTPATTPREEKVDEKEEKQKGVNTDPNAAFDSLWPWAAK